MTVLSPLDMSVEDTTALANQRLADVLDLVWRGAPAIVVDSPPGSGKSFLVEVVASVAVQDLGLRTAVACQTVAQTVELAVRTASAFPTLEVFLLTRRGGGRPPQTEGVSNLTVTDDVEALPAEPHVVLATSAKWSAINPDKYEADLLILDEAYQLTNATYGLVSGVAPRHLMVGDPGQIAPVTTAGTERWMDMPNGPHVPAPLALIGLRGGDVSRVRLPATRRLGQATTDLVQPAFYPDLPFRSIRDARRLVIGGAAPLIDAALSGGNPEMGYVEIASERAGVADRGFAKVIARLVQEACAGTHVEAADGSLLKVAPEHVGVVVPHVVQSAMIRAELGPAFADVMVDTTERHQGLEREFMVALHPLSGRVEATDFARDAGRLCVMLSRHRTACVVVGQSGGMDVLARSGAGSSRPVAGGGGYGGWRAHREVLERLCSGPVVTVDANADVR